MKKFNIPSIYKSSIIGRVKEIRKQHDPRKKDFTPSLLDFGEVQFLIARHFGFCYGVENAIEISYRALDENPGKRIFLLSQMIHNPVVNQDLQERGIQFIMDTEGNQLLDWDILQSGDVVIVPAFGTTLEIEEKLRSLPIELLNYNTTCPFVEKVWKRSEQLGDKDFTILIHGKHNHEETRATFSHAKDNASSVIIKDIKEAQLLGEIILGNKSEAEFNEYFGYKCSPNFDFAKDLNKIGVINQTTMLASETQEIAEYIKGIMIKKHGINSMKNHFADTRDTLCYATNDNQSATYGLLEEDADLAIVVGGYNSSNTSHIVELCQRKFPTFFIQSESSITDDGQISHYDLEQKKVINTLSFLPTKRPLKIVLTSGASCPDASVDQVLQKIISFFEQSNSIDSVFNQLEKNYLIDS